MNEVLRIHHLNDLEWIRSGINNTHPIAMLQAQKFQDSVPKCKTYHGSSNYWLINTLNMVHHNILHPIFTREVQAKAILFCLFVYHAMLIPLCFKFPQIFFFIFNFPAKYSNASCVFIRTKPMNILKIDTSCRRIL